MLVAVVKGVFSLVRLEDDDDCDKTGKCPMHCTNFRQNGRGRTTGTVLATLAPSENNFHDWFWWDCGRKCTLAAGCEFWSLEAWRGGSCRLMADKGGPAPDAGSPWALYSEGDRAECVEPAWRMAPLRTADPNHTAVAFVAFDKVGSTTMRRLAELATRKPVCNPWIDALQCRNSTSIVNVMGMYDSSFCHELRGKRRCRAFTVLRHPVARLLSSYAYFCKACAEGGRQCRGAERPTELVCPDMTLEDYARKIGNVYTKSLSRDDTVVGALKTLRSMAVLTERDLRCRKPLAKLSGWLQWPQLAQQRRLHVNKGMSKKAAATPALHQLLEPDIQLYEVFAKMTPWSCHDKDNAEAGLHARAIDEAIARFSASAG